MNNLLYHIIYCLIYPLALFPFRLLYSLSDFVYLLVYYVVRYRRGMVRKNLANAFPDKSPQELTRLEKRFYHSFCDYFFETVKLLNMSEFRMKKHFQFKNIELAQYFLDSDRPVVFTLGHYGNWEWVSSFPAWMQKRDDQVIGQIYRPLKNPVFDRLFLKIRSRFHADSFTKNGIYRDIIRMRRQDINWVIGFIADQKPSKNNIHYWTQFLNQETAVLTGPEKIAKQTGAVVLYLDVKKTRRGYYEGKIKLITENPAEEPEFAITEKYARLMEKSILRDPAHYLWTHNRWKHKRETGE